MGSGGTLQRAKGKAMETLILTPTLAGSAPTVGYGLGWMVIQGHGQWLAAKACMGLMGPCRVTGWIALGATEVDL